MRGLFTSALLVSASVTAFALPSQAGEHSHNVDVDESPSNGVAPIETVGQFLPLSVELPIVTGSNLDNELAFQPQSSPEDDITKLKHLQAQSNRVFQAAWAVIFIILLLVFVILGLHGRWSRSASTLPKTECHSRRAERSYRRAMRRAARKRIILDFLARLGYLKSIEARVDEEKAALLPRRVDEASSSPTMGDEISEFRNVAEIVGDMIAAEEGRSLHARARCDPVYVPGAGVEELSSHAQANSVHMAEEPPAYVTDDEGSKGNVFNGET